MTRPCPHTCPHDRARDGLGVLFGPPRIRPQSVTIDIFCGQCRRRIGTTSWHRAEQAKLTNREPWLERPYTDPARRLGRSPAR